MRRAGGRGAGRAGARAGRTARGGAGRAARAAGLAALLAAGGAGAAEGPALTAQAAPAPRRAALFAFAEPGMGMRGFRSAGAGGEAPVRTWERWSLTLGGEVSAGWCAQGCGSMSPGVPGHFRPDTEVLPEPPADGELPVGDRMGLLPSVRAERLAVHVRVGLARDTGGARRLVPYALLLGGASGVRVRAAHARGVLHGMGPSLGVAAGLRFALSSRLVLGAEGRVQGAWGDYRGTPVAPDGTPLLGDGGWTAGGASLGLMAGLRL